MTDPTTQDPPRPAPAPSSSSSTGGKIGYAVVNVTKLGGLAVVVHEIFGLEQPRPAALAIAAFMLAGAQGFDTLLDRVLGPRP